VAKTFGQIYTHKPKPPLLSWAAVAAIPLFILLAVFFSKTREHFRNEVYGPPVGEAAGEEAGDGDDENGGTAEEGGEGQARRVSGLYMKVVEAHTQYLDLIDPATEKGKAYYDAAWKRYGESWPRRSTRRGVVYSGLKHESGASRLSRFPRGATKVDPETKVELTDLDLAPSSEEPEELEEEDAAAASPEPSALPEPYIAEDRFMWAQMEGPVTISHLLMDDIWVRKRPWGVHGAITELDGEYPDNHYLAKALGDRQAFAFGGDSKRVGRHTINFGDLEGERYAKREQPNVMIRRHLLANTLIPYNEDRERFVIARQYINGIEGGRVKNLEQRKEMLARIWSGTEQMQGVEATKQQKMDDLDKRAEHAQVKRQEYVAKWDPRIDQEKVRLPPIERQLAENSQRHEAELGVLRQRRDATPPKYIMYRTHQLRMPERKHLVLRRETQWTIRPDGEVTMVLAPQRMCYINLGSGDGVRPGWRFEVYRRNRGYEFVHKAYIEVRNAHPEWSECIIIDREWILRRCPQCLYQAKFPEERFCPHCTGAQGEGARNLSGQTKVIRKGMNPDDPMQAGDLVWNPFFEKGRPLRFWILGGDGNFYSREHIMRTMRRYGAQIDEEMIPGRTNCVFVTRILAPEEQQARQTAINKFMISMHEWETLRFLEP